MGQELYIVTDSTADLRGLEIAQSGVRVVPLTILFGEEFFYDGESLHSQAFYQKWRDEKVVPNTSQPSPNTFLRVYRSILDQHPHAQILSIHLSEKLSRTIQSAKLACSMLPQSKQITILDSKTTSYGLGTIAMKLSEMARSGANIKECILKAETLLKSQSMYLIVDHLKYLRRMDRIGQAQFVVGSMFNFKPVLKFSTDTGHIYPIDRGFGRKNAVFKMFEDIELNFAGREIQLSVMHADAYDFADEIVKMAQTNLRVSEVDTRLASPVIGSNTGPGSCGILVRCVDA